MASINKVILVGNLGADPEVRYLASGDAVANLRLATTDKWKDKSTGEMKEATEWHRLSFFGKAAEVIGQYAKKGSQLYVEGKIQTRKFQDKETGADRYSTEIRGEVFQFLGGRSSEARQETPSQPTKAPAPSGGGMDDDCPFAPLHRYYI